MILIAIVMVPHHEACMDLNYEHGCCFIVVDIVIHLAGYYQPHIQLISKPCCRAHAGHIFVGFAPKKLKF